MTHECKPPKGPRLIRIVRGLSQSKLAALAGIDQALISRYENGLPVSKAAQAKIEAVLAPGEPK